MLTQNPHVSWKKMETSIWGGFTEMNICPEGLRWVGPLNRPATSIPGAATSTAQTENKKVKTESAVCETRVSVMRVCVFVYVCRRQGHRRSSFRGSYGETFSKLQHLRWEGCLLHSAYTPWRLRLRQIRFYVKLFFILTELNTLNLWRPVIRNKTDMSPNTLRNSSKGRETYNPGQFLLLNWKCKT